LSSGLPGVVEELSVAVVEVRIGASASGYGGLGKRGLGGGHVVDGCDRVPGEVGVEPASEDAGAPREICSVRSREELGGAGFDC
jgi:hypothetical protein